MQIIYDTATIIVSKNAYAPYKMNQHNDGKLNIRQLYYCFQLLFNVFSYLQNVYSQRENQARHNKTVGYSDVDIVIDARNVYMYI